jgi:hypothetical protein
MCRRPCTQREGASCCEKINASVLDDDRRSGDETAFDRDVATCGGLIDGLRRLCMFVNAYRSTPWVYVRDVDESSWTVSQIVSGL